MLQPRLGLLTLLLLSLLALPVRPSWAQTENKTAQKFDEFGDIQYSDIKARLDNFAIQLQNEPLTKGFILVYRSRRDLPGLNHRLAMRMKDYLVATRALVSERVATVDAGVAENLTQELWVVPPGTAPIPRSDARIGYLEHHDSAWKFDEYGFLPVHDYKRFGLKRDSEFEAEYLEAYANEVRKSPGQIACIIAYAQYNRHPPLADWADEYEPRPERRLDPPATARKQLSLMTGYLKAVYGITASSIKTIDGGYRKRRSIEFWIVPPGEPLPVPTPNSFPPKRKRGK
jgi:hypothetical protein